MLEAMQSTDNAFVTLTYEDKKLPLSSFGTSEKIYPTLQPRDLQLFLKRLRKELPTKLRFFAVGEYGDATFRPHYHFAGFNLSNCSRGETKKSPRSERCLWRECCPVCRMVGEIWGKGDIEVRGLDASKCEYLARYVTKKMTKEDDVRLLGRHPEFSRQSRRPGVGYDAVAQVAKVIRQYVPADELLDVPLTLKQGKDNHLPLGRYMRGKLRVALGMLEKAPDHAVSAAWEENMRPLWQYLVTTQALSLKEVCKEVNSVYEAQLRAKMAMRKGKL